MTHSNTKNKHIPLVNFVVFVCFCPCWCLALFRSTSHL